MVVPLIDRLGSRCKLTFFSDPVVPYQKLTLSVISEEVPMRPSKARINFVFEMELTAVF